MLTEAFRQAAGRDLATGRLNRLASPGTWEVAWQDGEVVLFAKHQIQWLINPNNCTLGPPVAPNADVPVNFVAAPEALGAAPAAGPVD